MIGCASLSLDPHSCDKAAKVSGAAQVKLPFELS
jgi:hypothetical protein